MIKNNNENNNLVEARIREALNNNVVCSLSELQVLETTTSTNDQVMAALRSAQASYVVCVANQQTRGRGRNGNVWQSPPGSNIYLSVGGNFETTLLNNISGLSLACGVVVARLLNSVGLNVGLKWPNDILLDDKKLAGILVETRIKAKQVSVVVGLGLNINMPPSAAQNIDQPWIDLSSALEKNIEHKNSAGAESSNIERNYWLSLLINGFVDCLQQYKKSGFSSFKDDWKKYEMLTGREVIIKTSEKQLDGRVLGYGETHALRVKINNAEEVFHAADIKLKLESSVSN